MKPLLSWRASATEWGTHGCWAPEDETADAGGFTGAISPVAVGADPRDWTVTAWSAGDGAKAAAELVMASTDDEGEFSLDLSEDDRDGAVYLLASASDDDSAQSATFAGILPADAQTIVLNERTTVAAAYALAQFVGDAGVSGPMPGLPNAALMAANLVDVTTGGYGEVLSSSPNGTETSALPAFTSLANMLSAKPT